ncbi:hypothetical protein [Streptomyces sp. SID13726]|uniref:hypothetical protein n=1 Tax=Streptomyces sp. SID13726 TaxID=2706058 RepID=UPI0013B9A321|nr:hypothetical protein [Streptomyces sp. SID13726]NEB04668.1 hypothetical protein [Streptomyces sp. SID13726]
MELPIAKYAFSVEELDLMSRAEWKITRECMREYDLAYDLERSASAAEYQPGSNRRYGVLNAQVASRYGYEIPDAAPAASQETVSEKQLLALNGRPGGTAEVNGRKVPEGGCLGRAKSEIRGRYTDAKGAEVASSIATESFTESLEAPDVVKATRDWSQCMKEKGFSYSTPLQALGADENSGAKVTRREISVATTDIACKESTGLVKIWSSRETAIQDSLIAKNQTDLKRLAVSHRKVVSEARSVLG